MSPFCLLAWQECQIYILKQLLSKLLQWGLMMKMITDAAIVQNSMASAYIFNWVQYYFSSSKL